MKPNEAASAGPLKKGFYAALLERCSRVTSTGSFIPVIDGLRFVAIMSVILVHIVNYLGEKRLELTGFRPDYNAIPLARLMCKGNIGVQIFFVISGFILSVPFAAARLKGEPPPTIRQYLFRRLTRLEPPYVISMVILFVLLLAARGLSVLELWPRLLAGLTYTHSAIYNQKNPINIVTWSLEVEVQFYLLAPLFFQIFRINNTLVRSLIFLCGIVGYPLLVNTTAYDLTLLGHFQYFLAGLMLAHLYVTGAWKSARKQWQYDVLGFGALAALCSWLYLGFPPHSWVTPILILMFEWGALRGTLAEKLLSIPTVVTVGGMCYTIYLYHEHVIYIVGRFSNKIYLQNQSFALNLVIQSMIFVPIIIISSGVLFVLFERPFMKRDWYKGMSNLPAKK